MTSRLIVSPAPYVPLAGLAIGREGSAAVPVDAGHPLPVELVQPRRPTFRSGVVGFVPVAMATDILSLYAQSYGRTILLEQVTISGTASSPAVIDVLIQRSLNGGGGTSVNLPVARLDMRDHPSTGLLASYSANRTSGGNGVDVNRPLLGSGKLHLGSATTPGNQLHFRYDQARRPLLRDLNEWLVVNLGGQTRPAGCQLDVMVEWSEVADVRCNSPGTAPPPMPPSCSRKLPTVAFFRPSAISTIPAATAFGCRMHCSTPMALPIPWWAGTGSSSASAPPRVCWSCVSASTICARG
ncbi:MAG: hypothetical protein WA842_13605 [Croceibacterium sp.]